MNAVQMLALVGGITGYIIGFIGIRLYFRFKEQQMIETIMASNPYYQFTIAHENEDK